MNARRNVLGRRGPDSLGLGRDGRPSPDSARGVPRLRDAEELVHGYGFPPLTEQAKRKLLGENYCRLHGLDVEAVKADVAERRLGPATPCLDAASALGDHPRWLGPRDGSVMTTREQIYDALRTVYDTCSVFNGTPRHRRDGPRTRRRAGRRQRSGPTAPFGSDVRVSVRDEIADRERPRGAPRHLKP
jgi:hypothetical protein